MKSPAKQPGKEPAAASAKQPPPPQQQKPGGGSSGKAAPVERVRKLQWRRKRSVHEFFPDSQVPSAQLIRKGALEYLGTGGKMQSTAGAIGYLLSTGHYWALLLVCLASVAVHLTVQLLRPLPPYLAVVNTLECAWYYGSNVSSANYRAVPYALPPRPPSQEEGFGPLKGAAAALLGRWRQPEPVAGLERCILAHLSSDCRFVGGIHACNVRSSPRFCAHYQLPRHTHLRQVRSPQAPKATVAPGSVELPEAPPLGDTQGEPAVAEDCLFLSVGRPRDYKTGYPVVAFVTGSGYVSETSRSAGQDSPLHPADGLPDKLQAVVVRLGYRLGFHGTFRPRGGGDGVVNLGLADLVCGLEHLQKVAESFGGNPDKVTLVGHGSGAAMVMALLHYQRRTGKRLARAAWLSSGPSRMPTSAPEMAKALHRIHSNRWTSEEELRLRCATDDTAECRKELESMDEGRLLAYLTANETAYKAWARSGLLHDWGVRFARLTALPGENSSSWTPEPALEWLAPDGVHLDGSPTEGDGLQAWDDVPVVFANVADHYDGFPGFRVSDQWKDNWQQVLREVESAGYAGSGDALGGYLQRPDMSRGDTHGLLRAARVASLLRQTCPYRYLAKKLSGAAGRWSNVYHYVQQYALKYPAKFLAIGDSRKLTGAFYGLDLLLMLGTARGVAESWDRRDQAVMQHLQAALSDFATNGRPPSGWRASDPTGWYTVVADMDGNIRSLPADIALQYCDSMPFDTVEKLRTTV